MELTLTMPATGSDLDIGWTGLAHNFPIVPGASLHYTLSGCDGKTTFDCTGTGQTGPGTPNGETFGAPLPLVVAGVGVCVVTRFHSPTLQGTFNLRTGDAGTTTPNQLPLNLAVYERLTFPEICPQCVIPGGGGELGSTGTCSSTSTNSGATCTVDAKVNVAGQGLYLLSSACPPLEDGLGSIFTILTWDIELSLTTAQAPPLVGPRPCPDPAGPQTSDDSCGGSACNARCSGAACASTDASGNCIDANRGISQLCCANDTTVPCFPTSPASKAAGLGSIIRTGKPVVPGDPTGGVFAGTFCIASTNSILDGIIGLPGPGAILLPAVATVEGPAP
jgi:hypothetical protein